MRSGSTGRLRKAICTERRSLSRSNGTRRPLRLMTINSRSCTRSKVVKRKLQARQTRRRRMTEESSVGRESFSCAFVRQRIQHFGNHRAHLAEFGDAEAARGAGRRSKPNARGDERLLRIE